MKVYSNKQIESLLKFIDTSNEYYATEADKVALKQYDACDDYEITDSLIEGIWKFLSSKINNLKPITLSNNAVTIFHTNAGTGKVLEGCPSDNVSIKTFNDDYTCKKICDLINQRFELNNTYKSEISDISHYFLNGDNGNTPVNDIVFTQPVNSIYYRGIDGTKTGMLDPIEYYSVRSLDFVTKGGYLCVLTHHRNFRILRSNKSLMNKSKIVTEISSGNMDEYGCLILKKN